MGQEVARAMPGTDADAASSFFDLPRKSVVENDVFTGCANSFSLGVVENCYLYGKLVPLSVVEFFLSLHVIENGHLCKL